MNDLLEQEIADLQAAKEVALSPRYLIRNLAQNDRYWSRNEGWTDYMSADTFLPDDVGRFELPTDGQWVPIEEACLIKIEPEQDLREMLTTGFESLLQSSLETKGFLVEQEWHVGGKSRGKFFFSGSALVIRAVMNQIDSARIQAGESVQDNIFSTARHLKETIGGLLLESSRQFVKIWAECPRLDQWNGTWIFESVLVATDKSINEEGSEGDDFKDIYGPGLPGAFAVPKGLGPEGQKAWEIIVDVLSSEGMRNAGITGRVFYGPDEQLIADPDCDLAIYHPGDSLRRFFVPDYGAILPFTKMKSALNKAGFVVESLSDWSVIYHQPLSEEQLVLIEKCLAEGIEDDELAAKDVMAIGCTDQITQAIESAGLVMAGAAPANQNFWPGRIIVTAYAPDEMDWHDKDTFLARQKATSYAEEAEQRIKKALAMPPMPRFSYTVFFEMKQGRWFFHFWVPDQAPVVEALGAARPVFTKEQHIQQFFMSNGLHVESMMEEPADPALGEAGQPGRIIRSVLQPDGDKPWTTAGVAGPELLNFLRRIKSELGETLETADIEYRTRFRQDLGAWRITWLIGNPVIHEAAEQSDDLELTKEVLPVGDFYPGVLVFRKEKPERIGRITKQVPYNHRDKIETTWMVDWGPSLYLEPVRQSDLEIAPVKPTKTNEALDDDFETELAKEVGPVPPPRMKMPSGLEGWQDYLQNVYGDFGEFERYSETYGLAQRLGFESAEAAWAANPLIHGSVQPSDSGTAQESTVSALVDRLAEGEELTEHTEEGDDDRVGVVGVFRKNGDGYQVLVARREVDPQAGCFNKGTRILMADGTLKAVEHVAVGDLVMGIDSLPKRVKSLGRGRETMYRVIPAKGASFVCNESHILTLKQRKVFGRKHQRYWGKLDITVRDLLVKSRTFRDSVRLYKSGVSFGRRPVKIDPYFLGLWLGDGTSTRPAITTTDEIIVARIAMEAIQRGLHVTKTREKYLISGQRKGSRNSNSLTADLRGYNVWNNKHIPADYLLNDEHSRLELLAGLLDSDGHLAGDYFEFGNKSERLVDDFLFLARSLGFAAYERPKESSTGIQFRVNLFGDIDRIPTRLFRKRASSRKTKKPWLCTRIKEIRPIGENDYYGFVLETSPYFLLSDFTVVHNSWCLPGGHAQVGEDILDGTKREMKEETHLDLDGLTFVKKIRNEERDAYVYVYGAILPDGDRAKAGDDAEKIKWVPVDDLPDLAFDNNKLVKEIADKMELDAELVAESSLENKWKAYYAQYGGVLADKLEVPGYHLSLWHYPEDDSYEVNIAQEDVDWSDPATHTAQRPVGHIPRAVLNKIAEWMNIRGHLAVGSHNEKRLAVYKRLFQRGLGAKIVDIPWAVPGGGHYFVAITTDHDVFNRAVPAKKPGPQESVAESDVKPGKGMYIEPGISADVLKIIQAETDTARKRGTHQGCEERSFIWAQIFDEAGFRDRIKVVYGNYAGEPAVPSRHDPHVYLRVDGKVFDPTAWQYQDYPTMDPAKYADSKHVVEAHESGQIKLAESIDVRFERMIGEDKAKNRYGKDGFLVVFEGIDGSGKTTNIERLADWLNEKDYSYVTTKWASSKALHDALWKAKCKKRLTPMSFSLIHASDMHIRYENIIVPALKKGKVVICDRYYFTSYVRDKIRGIDEELLDMVYEGFRKPDLIFFLHVPVRIAVERLMADRGVGYYSSGQDVGYGTKGVERTTERYEKDMQDRYEKLFKKQSNVVRLDAARPLKEIARDIKHEIRKHLGLKENSD